MAPGQGEDLQQEGQADDVGGSRLPKSAGMRAQQVRLKVVELVFRDGHVAECAKTRIDAVVRCAPVEGPVFQLLAAGFQQTQALGRQAKGAIAVYQISASLNVEVPVVNFPYLHLQR